MRMRWPGYERSRSRMAGLLSKVDRAGARRLLLLLLALVVAVTELTPLGAPRAVAAGPATIEHVPAATTFVGRPIDVIATTTCAATASCPTTLVFRTTGGGSRESGPWQRTDMTKASTTGLPDGTAVSQWTATVPASFVDSTGIDYYLEAVTPDGVVRTPAGVTDAVPLSYHVHAVSPPVPQHVPSLYAADDTGIEVELRSTCSTGDCRAKLYYRTTPEQSTPAHEPLVDIPDWPNVEMQRVESTPLGDVGEEQVFRALIPADVVDTRGVDYFMQVTDGNTRAFWPGTTYQGYLPTDGVRTGWMHVHVLEAPHIVHQPVLTTTYREAFPVEATASCSQVRDCSATLYWRTTDTSDVVDDVEGNTPFDSGPMQVRKVGVNAAGQDLVELEAAVPASAVDTRGVEYFFSLTDGATTTWWPGTSQVDGYVAVPGTRVGYHHTRVLEPPHIVPTTPPVATPAQPFDVTIRATCATEQCTARLFYAQRSITGAVSLEPTQFTEVPLEATGQTVPSPAGQFVEYSATIPADEVTTRGLLWYAEVSDGYTRAYAPGTSYNGAFVPVDGHQLPPAGYPTSGLLGTDPDRDLGDRMNLPRGTAAFPVRVLEPPHVVHAYSPVVRRGQPLILTANSNCARATCEARLWYIDADGEIRVRPPASSTRAADGLWTYTFQVSRRDTFADELTYRISVSDGWVTDTTPTLSPATSEEANLGVVGGTVAYDITPDQSVSPIEPRMGGVKVKVALVGLDGVAYTLDDVDVGSDVTDTDGTWAVAGLAPQGKYAVTLDPNTLPNTVRTAPALIRQTRTLTAAKPSFRDVDFPLPSADIDADGVPDVAEAKIGIPRSGDDIDRDGLTDRFEINRLFGLTMPNDADTDGDEVSDADEDSDGDGLANRREQTLGTNPANPDTDRDDLTDDDEATESSDPQAPDTDGDGLNDGREVRNNTSPIKVDSDSDGIPDPEDTVEITRSSHLATVTLTGEGDLAGAFTATSPNDVFTTGPAPGRVSEPVQLEVDPRLAAMESARIRLPYPTSFEGDPADLRLFYFDETQQFWVPGAADEVVDTANRTVSGTVSHFSIWAIFDIRNWNQTFNAVTPGCDDPRRNLNVDVVFVLDDSGSMVFTDPKRLRVQSAKNFVDALKDGDRGGVITFTTTATTRADLTESKPTLRTALDVIGFGSGGTNIGAGVQQGLALLEAAGNGDGPGRSIILLTDGAGDYDHALTDQARAANISINTIGLGSAPSESLLRGIASGTLGTYHQVATADDLPQVFRELDDEIQGTRRDSDGDGFLDCAELRGLLATNLERYHTNPFSDDTDQDGLLDQEEILVAPPINDIYALTPPGALAYNFITDPTDPDSDHDEIPDGLEVAENETEPLSPDSDHDGLSDAGEEDWNSNSSYLDSHPYDTDDDGIVDGEDSQDGFDPLKADKRISNDDYVVQFARGCFLGEWIEIDTLTELSGAIACSVAPIVGTAADVRDLVAGVTHGDWVGAGFSVLGVVPIAGDLAKSLKFAAEFARQSPSSTIDAARELARLNNPASEIVPKLEELYGDAISTIRAADPSLTDEALVALARTRTDMQLLADALEHTAASGLGRIAHGELPSQFLNAAGHPSNWRQGERAIEALAGAADGAANVTRGTYVRIAGTQFLRGRFVDACSHCHTNGVTDITQRSVLREAKTGRQRLSSRIERQLEKDAKIATDTRATIEWHFMASDYGVEVTTALLDKMDQLGIRYVIHMPS